MAKTTAPKTAAPKTPKATPPAAPKAGRAKDPNRLGKPFVATLQVLSVKGPLSRAQISEAIGLGSGFTSLLGHLDPAKREPQSLSARGLIRPSQHDVDGKDVVLWEITAAGRKALAAAKKTEAAK